MQITSITDLMRNGKKSFTKAPYSTVVSNNEPVGTILSAEFSALLTKNGVLDQLLEEYWELQDPTTRTLVESYQSGEKADEMSLDDFRTKYGV